jgi:apolipoprotein N-acyltransferase
MSKRGGRIKAKVGPDRRERLAAGVLGFAAFVRARTGWQRYGLAALAGVGSAGAMAPAYAAPLLFLTFPLLIWLVDGTQGERRGLWIATLVGGAFGFGFFLAGLYWVGFAFLVDEETFGWMIPFVEIFLSAGLALFVAAVVALTRALGGDGWPRILLFAAVWTISEWLRGHILTGFPWNLMGYAWGSLLPMMQGAAYVGVYGLSFITVLAASSAALAGDPEERVRGVDLRIVPALSVLALFLLGLLGTIRLGLHPSANVEHVKLRIVHAAIPQRQIDDPAMREPIFANYLALTARPGLADVSAVIWPEAAVPFPLSRDPAALDAVAQTLPDDTVLLTGALRVTRARNPDQPPSVFNSLHALDGEGRILVTYDKAHLVPFGEYLPMEKTLEALGLTKLTGGLGSFARGPGPRTLAVPGLPPFGPLICYEVIFPHALLDPALRPGWLVNVTDDSWFGSGAGPRQHFAAARMRSIEEGLPLVRAANRGISAIIDPVGRIVASAAPDKVGVLDGPLPNALPRTLYGRLGDLLACVFVALASALALLGARRRKLGKLLARAVGPASVP